ncbi:type IV secretion system DNA-binding domain-containing protein [Vibrio sp. PNB22_2_2]
MSHSPNSKYQLWPQMVVFYLMLWGLLFFGLAYLTWTWGEEPSWGSFDMHFASIKHAFGLLVPVKSTDRWYQYWYLLDEYDLRTKFYIHVSLPFVTASIFAYYLTKKLLWVKGGRENVVHIKGPKLYQGKQAIKHASSNHKQDLKRDKRAADGINIHPQIAISSSREQTNFLVLGTTGAGKSMVVKPMLNSIISRGDRALIFDEKKEYTRSFYHENSTVLIAPWDSRGTQWFISGDVLTQQDAYLIANCLIPTNKSKDEMWVKGARLIFVGMLVSLIGQRKPWGWVELAQLLSLPQKDMLEKLTRYFPIAKSFIVEKSKTTQGFYVNLIAELSWLEELATTWPYIDSKGFSIKKWISKQTNRKIIIIQSDSRYEAIGAPLCNALISLMTRYYLAKSDDETRRTWLVIDEAANLPVNPMLLKWLELARSKGARSIISTQSISRLVDLYSQNNTDAMLNLLSTVISLRIGPAGEDAKHTAKIFGERIVERPSSLEPNSNWQRSKEPLVEEFELTHLKPAGWQGVNGYLFIPGWNAAYKLRWPLFSSVSVAKEHIPAAWISKRKSIQVKEKKNRLTKRTLKC